MVPSHLSSPTPSITRSSGSDCGGGPSYGGEQILPAGYVAPEWLGVREAAACLGIKPTTFYSWLGLSDRGLLVIRGRGVTIQYFQGGPAGQGRIQIEYAEILRLRELMRVRPQPVSPRRPPAASPHFPGISVPLGRPPGL